MSEEKMKELSKQNNEKREADVQKAMERIESERKEMDEYRRFGYFTIPYPATVGDKAYSIKNNFQNHKLVDGKIITENRNIFVRPLLKGRTPEVYFQRVEAEPDETVEKHKEMNKKEHEAMVAKVHASREAKAIIQFKPGGPQETFGFYKDVDQPEPTGTLYIKPDPKRFILEGGKVKTENRGIFTNPAKNNKHLIPNEYFSFYYADDATEERIKTLGEKDIKDKLDKVKERRENKPTGRPPFHPASLKKCEPFYNNIETYGVYNEEERLQKLQEYREYKKVGNKKYSKSLPKGCVQHDRPFAPARLIYTGRDGLFYDDLYKLPELTEKDKKPLKTVKERKEEEEKNKNKRMPFTYNKLMKDSRFAPPISSFTTNLKKEFPTIKFH